MVVCIICGNVFNKYERFRILNERYGIGVCNVCYRSHDHEDILIKWTNELVESAVHDIMLKLSVLNDGGVDDGKVPA